MLDTKNHPFSGMPEKIQRMYQRFLKEGNGDYNFLICPEFWEKNLEIMRSEIEFDKVEFECAGTVKAQHIGNDSGFIT